MTIPPEILDRLVSIRVKQAFSSSSGWVTVERRDMGLGAETRWAVCCCNDRLSTFGAWDYASMPSHRPDGWNESHQWATFAEAWDAAMAANVD